MNRYRRPITLAMACLFLSGCAQMAWNTASSKNTVKAYKTYFTKHPDGEHSAEAVRRIEVLNWTWACEKNHIRGYEAYLKAYPDGPYFDRAEQKIKEIKEKRLGELIIRYRGHLTASSMGFPVAGSSLYDVKKELHQLLSEGVDPNAVRIKGFSQGEADLVDRGVATIQRWTSKSVGNAGEVVPASEGGISLLEYCRINKMHYAYKLLEKAEETEETGVTSE